MIRSYEDIEAYRRAYMSSLEIHKLSLTFPTHEMRELGGQIRRSTKSIPMNIAEGYGKRVSAAEFKRFLLIAVGSCDEVRVQLDYCKDLDYISTEQHKALKEEYNEIGKMLNGLYKNWK